MRSKIFTVAALSTLIAAPAFAQSTPPSAQTPPPATSAPSTDMKSTMPPAGSSAATGSFIDAQNQDQWLGTDLIGTKVSGTGDESLGEVSDVVIDRNGTIIAAVIGVGGFLGVGQKDVAVPFNALQMTRSSSGDKLVLAKTKDELKAAPTFKPYTPPAPTGGSATAPATTPPAATR